MQAYTNNHEQARGNLVSAIHLLEGQTSSEKFNSLRAAIHLRLAESHARTETDLLSAWVGVLILLLSRCLQLLTAYQGCLSSARRGIRYANRGGIEARIHASICGIVVAFRATSDRALTPP